MRRLLIRDLCVILMQTYFESNQDSGHLAHQQNQIGKVGMQNSACLTTFLSTMRIGLSVISGSCISKLTGWKFTSFLSSHLCQCQMFSVMRLQERMNTSKMTQIERTGKKKFFMYHNHFTKSVDD